MEVGLDGLQRDLYYFLAAPPDFEYGKLPFDGPTRSRERGSADEQTVPGDALAQADSALERARPTCPRFVEIARIVLAKSSPSLRKTKRPPGT